jgi:hypothetical protein
MTLISYLFIKMLALPPPAAGKATDLAKVEKKVLEVRVITGVRMLTQDTERASETRILAATIAAGARAIAVTAAEKIAVRTTTRETLIAE